MQTVQRSQQNGPAPRRAGNHANGSYGCQPTANWNPNVSFWRKSGNSSLAKASKEKSKDKKKKIKETLENISLIQLQQHQL
ncbi:hypothetical protein CYMTET_7197 [Cymbomonas tetramitiformis]|uniref:Uncharacterized protein n=1 Tax=Cymbomonas tetramitiformis TaxID=36881 RepID=A0AAE0LH87_9CHLO|nr:hypothetical protein CYMTET_7197 [Cymbomonas tetramitiformis]